MYYLLMYLLHNGPVTFFFKQAEINLDGSVAKASLNIFKINIIKALSLKKKTRNQVIYAWASWNLS